MLIEKKWRDGRMSSALINKRVVTIYGRPEFDNLTKQSQTSTIQDEGLYGMPVQILERIGSWVKIQTHYRYMGYVHRSDLKLLTQAEENKWKANINQLRVIMKSYADILACDKVQGIRLRGLTRGALVTLVEPAKEAGGWAKVCLNDGQEGYIKEGFLGFYYTQPYSQDEETLRKRLVDTAKLYLGTQYRWGGKSPLGIDCSGLTSMAYLLNGIVIYRDAKLKEGFGIQEIKFEDKKPGDLLYFPGHIAMYIGEDRYIHSTAHNGSDGVVINSLNPKDPDYREDLVKSLYAAGSYFVTT